MHRTVYQVQNSIKCQMMYPVVLKWKHCYFLKCILEYIWLCFFIDFINIIFHWIYVSDTFLMLRVGRRMKNINLYIHIKICIELFQYILLQFVIILNACHSVCFERSNLVIFKCKFLYRQWPVCTFWPLWEVMTSGNLNSQWLTCTAQRS